MHLDGFFLEGVTNKAHIHTAGLILLAFWLLGLVLCGGLVFLRQEDFSPSANWTSTPVAVFGNLICFSLLVMLQLTVETVIFLWGKPIGAIQNMTQLNLGPWIVGHLIVGIVGLALVLTLFGQDEQGTFVLLSAIPTAIATIGLVYLGALWWPSLFSNQLLISAIRGSQIVAAGLILFPAGLLAVFCLFCAFQWAYEP